MQGGPHSRIQPSSIAARSGILGPVRENRAERYHTNSLSDQGSRRLPTRGHTMSCHHRPGTTLLPEFRLEMFRCSRERSVSREVLTNLLSAGSDERSTFTSKVIESLFLSGNNSGN